MRSLILALVGAGVMTSAAQAEPILPAQDRAGALLKYQLLVVQDRRATLEAFTGKSMRNQAVFQNLDACTLRQTTEDGAAGMRLSKVIAACVKELNL
ncbi:hypothetical protein [Aquabacter spiritensis]|uniref:UrcA family protein n=1 Tax=Aquabacter spiritensis TaxID=933073 RepID=A0A4R3LSG9_9HYPH|nr:hypothetical protein [Aquabacter spiritensis]TCT03504.1 hypothetical protein EDC64_10954 [Aquabacter spiritensis]